MRWEVINHLANIIKERLGVPLEKQQYLEIGINKGYTIQRVLIENKDGVDPQPQPSGLPFTNYKVTSDEFFHLPSVKNKRYHIIFIDGLHLQEQVWKDLLNSLSHIEKGGFIVMDDIYPEQEIEQVRKRPPKSRYWTGDVWKAWYHICRLFPKHVTVVLDESFRGMGILDTLNLKNIPLPSSLPDTSNLQWPKDVKSTNNVVTLKEFTQKPNSKNV